MSDNRYQITKKVTLVGMFINALLAISKTLIGVIGRSPALFADGIHSFSDLLSDFMVLFAAKYANKGEDHNHPYGHERLETLATLVLSGLLITIGFMIVYHSLVSLLGGEYVIPDKFTVYAAIFSIFGNEFIYQYTMRAANKIDSDLLRANAWHSRSDMWSSVVVLVGLFGAFWGFAWMDAIAAFIVCFMIVKMGVKWGYSAVAELIDEGVDDQTRQDIKAIIAKTQGVEDFHYLRTRKMAGKIVLDVHILVDKFSTASEGHYIAEIVKSNIYHNIDNIKDITVHVDVTNHESGVIKQENFEPSRAEILTKIKEFFAENNIDENVILDKKMSIYYFDDEILVDLYVKRSNDLKRLSDKLSKLSYRGYNICVTLYCNLANS
ncbi:cation diffusion facilitator family transporter [Francisella tularensis]|uniref:cation diffusion facilitator family transporter n=1 Tax=Francisella tularensis TaxID=263 RepID=UPI0000F5911C|nr:cation diffusion facilitator family transporter [Francisella tularensis]ABO46561.1 cation-efflux family protein [Francisella tularensis subsp. tularensis WY96-3418]AJI63893.1 cation diffusion facilitator transporter family protein [Francisella tularensis subsp. tularensis]AKU73688.1 cation diffusion facilitator transporter family protein [Francisella tularensis subsp. tularensis]EKM87600.1 cation-efflux family protein [Francisella tularensis subsp. tularensis 831]EKM87725.1 cation-efflux fa